MPCYHPLDAWQLACGSVVFAERGDVVRSLSLPCGRCIGCRLERARQWSIRCVHESKMHERNCVVTLTYDDMHLPVDRSLDYRHFQLFMKKLRRRFSPVRFYMCGEYGENEGRPHYHSCLFGVDFPDKVYAGKSRSGSKLWTSDMLSSLWEHGSSNIGELTYESAGYIARYIVSKCVGDLSLDYYLDVDTGVLRVPEFNRMSLKPGIGAKWFEKWEGDVYPHDRVVLNGRVQRPPKFYDKLLARRDPLAMEELSWERLLKFDTPGLRADRTPDRLAVREVCHKARNALKKRSLRR